MISDYHKSKLFDLVYELGKRVELIKNRSFISDFKNDKSPVTEADYLVNRELIKFIKTTSIKNFISEEVSSTNYIERACWNLFWIIDPIDGTKEFITKGDDYTINIALCKKNIPIFSVVHAPARKELFYGEINKGAYKNDKRIKVSDPKKDKINIVASKSHINKETYRFIEAAKENYEVNLMQFGSSLKICKVAEGIADIYPRFGPTMEWDVCAADLILSEAGGHVLDLKGKSFTYNKEDLLNPFFIATSHKIYCK